MTKHYPVEALLRPPAEWWTTLVGVSIGTTALLAPNMLMLSLDTGLLFSTGCFALAALRFKQGLMLYRYRKNLTSLSHYALISSAIPKRSGKLFLGLGFAWRTKHTQRLYDCNAPAAEQFLKKSNPDNPTGGNTLLHGVEPSERDVWLNQSERVGHTLVLGTTRVGKTRLLEVLVSQDIERGDTVIVFDPKGDADLLRRLVFEAKRANREDDLIIFHLGFPKVSARYNPIGSFTRVTEVANRVANQLPGSGESAAFREFAWRFINIIARALVALGRKPDYTQIQRYILNIDSLLLDYCQLWLPTVAPNWQAQVQTIEDNIKIRELPHHMQSRSKKLIAIVNYIQRERHFDAIADGLCSAFNYDKTYFDKITASLLPLLEKLTTGQSAALISPDYFDLDDERPIFDWLQVIRGKKIVYVGLDALSDATIAGAVGNSMFADLCSVAGQLYKYGVEENIVSTKHQKTFHPVCVHSDEFNELIGDEFIPLLNKAGGAGIQVTAYTQTWSDIEARLGNAAKAGQVAGNLNSLICMRVLDEKTAKHLTSKLPQRVAVKSLLPVSGVSDSTNANTGTDFNSSNEDRIVTTEVPMLSPDHLIQLPKGQAYALLNGGRLWKLRIPLPEDDMSNIPSAVEAMAHAMQQNYQSKLNTSMDDQS